MIELRNISAGYGNRKLVKDADALFAPSTLTALTGRNGSGKSTLLRAIAGLGKICGGEIAVDGKTTFASAMERAKSIAFVNTQRVRIANMRCRDLVGLGRAPYTDWAGRLSRHDKAVVEHALATVGMSEYAERTLDTMSDGECQRVMIARALAQDTPNILLDEPTSFLDLPNRHQLMELLGNLAHNQGKTILLSTHELDIALSAADTIALIDTPRLLMLPTSDSTTRTTVATVFGLNGL
ncbi:MAG: ABC transporter ATP-binding protein [Muribaculaceae bacterium]|nr:ABC transporter ATP-binding protein [Muribaculaceae bacterium]MDE6346779.1 ABC transporter ATP-binding protein [Muribaculaceae bacterium]